MTLRERRIKGLNFCLCLAMREPGKTRDEAILRKSSISNMAQMFGLASDKIVGQNVLFFFPN